MSILYLRVNPTSLKISVSNIYFNTTTECNFEYEETYQLKDTPFKTQMLLLKSL